MYGRITRNSFLVMDLVLYRQDLLHLRCTLSSIECNFIVLLVSMLKMTI